MIERFQTLFSKKRLAFILAPLLIVFALTAGSSCDTAAQQEGKITTQNHESINSSQPLPNLTYSQRREVLNDYYTAEGDQYMLTCTMITSRGSGGNSGNDVIGIAPTIGMPVNLSNQVTAPGTPEPDTVYSGTNDQTAFILRNGHAMAVEADTNAVSGDCKPGIHPDTYMQREIDYIMSLPPDKTDGRGHVNFCPKQDCSPYMNK